MNLSDMTPLLKVYYEPKRRELTEKVRKKGFGWSPCEHYDNAIGWCPYCLKMKWELERMVEVYGEP